MKEITKYSLVTAFSLSLVFSIIGPRTAFALASAPPLGTMSSFSALSATALTSANVTTISGDLGEYSGITKTGTWTHTGGSDYIGTGLAASAQNDALTAYNYLVGVNNPSSGTWSLNATPLPGVWTQAASPSFSGTLTLNGDASSVWVFQLSTDFTFDGSVVLGAGVNPCNVFWAVAGSATITTGTPFIGTLIALAGNITSAGGTSGVTVNGRLITHSGYIHMDGVSSSISGCAVGTIPASAPVPGVVAPLPPVFTPPLINVTKIPTPLALPTGPGSVTYDYVVTNVGTVPIFNVAVTDNKCAPVSYVSGDTNGNSRLGTTETWKYRCTTTLSQTTANTVTATGQGSSGLTTTDTADAIVVVGVPLIPPLIHLVKVPNVFVLPAGGGAVTYSYSVTNPGTVPLSDISITDNKCTGLPSRVVGHPGDINKNNLLDPGETFHFTCQTNLTQTTTNIGTATGHANGFTITDTSPATVVVATAVPKLPNTGFPSSGTSTPWDAVIAIGILILVSSSLVALKKRTV